jgi:hypothetical protein
MRFSLNVLVKARTNHYRPKNEFDSPLLLEFIFLSPCDLIRIIDEPLAQLCPEDVISLGIHTIMWGHIPVNRNVGFFRDKSDDPGVTVLYDKE